jgi:hypothetical protein
MEKKIVVPEGMLRATWNAMEEHMQTHNFVGCVPGSMCSLTVGIEAALLWWSENPIVPTLEQAAELWRVTNGTLKDTWPVSIAVEWQRRMFLAPEPKMPDAVKQLLKESCGSGMSVEALIVEAYNRGLKGAK